MIILFRDRTCAKWTEIQDSVETHWKRTRRLDPNEAEGLSREETIRLMQIAKEEAKGRIPVTGKVEPRNAQWTWDVIDEAERVIEAGADVLYVHPWPEMDNMEDFVNLYRTLDRAFDIPIIALMAGVPPSVLKEIALACRNIAAWKFENREDIGLMKQLVWSMQEVEAKTGRHVCPLRAGDQGLAECLVNGADGNFKEAAPEGREDVAIYKAVKRGPERSSLSRRGWSPRPRQCAEGTAPES
jgi:dihydrodipicolinate synthase/N-acetylneuraminate lyase